MIGSRTIAKPSTANLDIRNAGVQDLLALAGQKDTPVTGTLTATAQISGTLGDPRGTVSADSSTALPTRTASTGSLSAPI